MKIQRFSSLPLLVPNVSPNHQFYLYLTDPDGGDHQVATLRIERKSPLDTPDDKVTWQVKISWSSLGSLSPEETREFIEILAVANGLALQFKEQGPQKFNEYLDSKFPQRDMVDVQPRDIVALLGEIL